MFRADPAVRAAMVATDEADVAPSIAALDATNPETDFSYLDSETIYIRLDHFMPPVNDIRVRKALNMAIDREAFIGTLLPRGDVTLATALFTRPRWAGTRMSRSGNTTPRAPSCWTRPRPMACRSIPS